MRHLKSIVAALGICAFTFSVNADQRIDTELGQFEIITGEQKAVTSREYTVKFSGELLAVTEMYREIKAFDLGVAKYTGGLHSILVNGVAGGNACSDIFTVLRFRENYRYVSPPLYVCGGVKSIDKNGSIVIIRGFERDGVTKVKYVVNSDQVSKNGKPFTSTLKFF
ncbi:hypothetical protein [Vibrio alginolyticus]|uniref:hypothetical protein n=1 Tax=Vibrio alginolyticus TaxID=663 RepID=UPI0006CA8D17|nr:hypothetical protein [Vibrio alginolyticus]KPM97547.1 hypothetical protein AOG25_13845 [Vibrio alginolyticus]